MLSNLPTRSVFCGWRVATRSPPGAPITSPAVLLRLAFALPPGPSIGLRVCPATFGHPGVPPLARPPAVAPIRFVLGTVLSCTFIILISSEDHWQLRSVAHCTGVPFPLRSPPVFPSRVCLRDDPAVLPAMWLKYLAFAVALWRTNLFS